MKSYFLEREGQTNKCSTKKTAGKASEKDRNTTKHGTLKYIIKLFQKLLQTALVCCKATYNPTPFKYLKDNQQFHTVTDLLGCGTYNCQPCIFLLSLSPKKTLIIAFRCGHLKSCSSIFCLLTSLEISFIRVNKCGGKLNHLLL